MKRQQHLQGQSRGLRGEDGDQRLRGHHGFGAEERVGDVRRPEEAGTSRMSTRHQRRPRSSVRVLPLAVARRRFRYESWGVGFTMPFLVRFGFLYTVGRPLNRHIL